MIPIIYESSWLSIQTLWVFVVIALLLSSYLAVKRLKRRRVNFTLFIEHSTFFMICALVFSRVLYFFTHPDAYFPAFDLRTLINFVSIWDQGFSFWGAVIGFALALSFTLHKAKEDFWRWYDALSVPFLIGIAIGMIGAFLSGYAYGTPTELPWAVRYEVFHVKYTVPVHPTQVYLILGIVLILWGKNKLKQKSDFFETNGNTTLFLASCYSLLSALLEFIRGDDTLLLLGIKTTIIFYSVVFLASSYLLFKRYKNYKNEPVQATES